MTTKYIINAGAAIVSRKIVERTGNIKWLIREEPFAPQDTGWRILSDRDTDEYLADPATASKETRTPQSRFANTPMSRAAWRGAYHASTTPHRGLRQHSLEVPHRQH